MINKIHLEAFTDCIHWLFPTNKKSFSVFSILGIVAGGGRVDKPILKAGRSYHKFKAKRKAWPVVRGVAMNVSNLLYLIFYQLKMFSFQSSLSTIHSVVVTINILVNHRQSIVMRHLVEKLVLLLLDVLVVYVVRR